MLRVTPRLMEFAEKKGNDAIVVDLYAADGTWVGDIESSELLEMAIERKWATQDKGYIQWVGVQNGSK